MYLIKKILKKDSLNKILINSGYNIAKSICLLEMYLNNITEIESINNNDENYSKIINYIINNKSFSEIYNIRDLIYNLLYDNSPSKIIETITFKILDKFDIDNNKKYQIIKIASDSDYNSCLGFRNIYHLEYFCINLINIFN